MALFFSVGAVAQNNDLGTWSVLSGKYTLNKQWNLFFEGQIRSQEMYNQFNYYEYKGGVGYNFPKSVSALFAMGHYNTFQPEGNFKGPKIGNEFRIWEQFVITNDINRFKLEHRYRIEQRFTTDGYRNRFRYRINGIYPLNNTSMKEKTWYLSLYNEIFLNNEGLFFENNRMYAGIGYQINNRLTLQAGWLNRFDNLGAGKSQSKNFMQTILLFSLNEFKTGREPHPSSVD